MLKLFAVRDVKSESYSAPTAIATRGLAVRAFTEACLDPKSEFARYSTDYMLYEIGSWDPNTGVIVSHSVPSFVCSATEVIAPARIVEAVPV